MTVLNPVHRDLAPGPTDAVRWLAVQARHDDSSSRQGLGRPPAASVGPSLGHGATGSEPECQWPGSELRLHVGSGPGAGTRAG